ncbi:oligosaccharide flippase family protein [Pikeienuella piscinae]|uniref:Oligosaccharide flippase family protein n=1 Tax=Pikeienuella piscinae TaxID=2748098 RepID=A0A7L5BZB1_9RHOB|nr:oligosaccharide flippase family protein [Pikeienuella piscinae]QIE56443.1 oligosaccharide flippase family protein [Pikeienuella piscinae]
MALPDWARSTAPDGRFSAARGGIGRGLSLNMLSAVFQLLGAVLSTVILSRILLAEDFGVYGMIMPFVAVLLLVVDGGSVYYMLRSEQVVEREADGLFWYALACGAAGACLLLIASPGIAWAMNEERLVGAGAVAACALLFSGLGSQHGALMMRCFRNDLRALAIIGGVVAGVGLGLALAVAGLGYWALIALLTVRIGATSLLYIGLSGWRPGRPKWDGALLADIVRLARPTLAGRVVLAVVRESDKIIVGLLYSTASAGFYAFAQMLSVMPLLQIVSPTLTVVLPWLSEIKSDRDEVFRRFWDLLCIFTYVFLAPALFASLFAGALFALVLGAEMQPSAAPFRILIVSAVAGMAFAFAGISFQVMDRPDITERQHYRMALIFALCYALAALDSRFETIAIATLVGNTAALALRLRACIIFYEAAAAAAVKRLAKALLASAAPALLVLLFASAVEPGAITGGVTGDLFIHAALFTAIYAALGFRLFAIDPRQIVRRLRARR